METNNQPNATSVQLFQNAKFGDIRIATNDINEPLFCLADVCNLLDLQTNKVKDRINENGWCSIPVIDSMGRNQKATFVNESNFYKVVFQSRKPEAEEFTDWVTGEVLPAIRKTGGYIQSAPDETPEMLMARALHVANQTIEANKQRVQMLQGTVEIQEKQITDLTPLAEYTDKVLQSKSTYTLTQVAKDLNMRSVYVFTEWLYKKGIMYKQSGQWMPTAKVSGKHYFTTRTSPYIKNGEVCSSLSTVITELGRAWLHTLYKQDETAA